MQVSPACRVSLAVEAAIGWAYRGEMVEWEDRTERGFVDAHGHDPEAVKLAIAWLVRVAAENGHGRVTVLVSSQNQLDSLAEILGISPARLRKDKVFSVEQVSVKVVTERQLLRESLEGAVLGLWVDDGQLEKWLDGADAPALCVVPWNRADIAQWKANWNPVDLRTGEPDGTGATVGNQVVVAALESLTAAVNLSTGLSHPSDKEAAVQVFRLLRDAGEPLDPSEVQAWAVTHGWRPKHARELAELAKAILDRRPIRAGRMRWKDDIVEQWREKSRGDGG